jgi:integrase
MAFYELRHFCATHLLELGVSHADVAVQLGHTDGGALVMSTYGHPSDEAARERLLDAYKSGAARHLRVVSD